MSKTGFTPAETCDYISAMALELKRLAEAAGADEISTVLSRVVELADEYSRKQQPASDRGKQDERV